MLKRTLGRTKHNSTIITFGTYAIGYVDQHQADHAIQLALDHGINHVDIAPSYGHAMERIAPWMSEIRDKIFLGAKTARRKRDDAWQDIESITRRMNTDKFDLFQLHSVGNLHELDRVTAPDGALETLIEMREQGITKWIGITGHGPQVPSTMLEALDRFDFDTVMFPLNPAIDRDPDYHHDSRALLAECNKRNIGIQTIKMIARGGWNQDKSNKDLNTWYDPHRNQDEIDRSLWWVLSQPIHTAPSCGEITLLPKVLDAAERFTSALSPNELQSVTDSQNPPLPLPALAIPATATSTT